MSEQTVAVDFTQLLEPADTQAPEVQATPLEQAIAEAGAKPTSTDLVVARPEDSPFKFRSLRTEKQLADLQLLVAPLSGIEVEERGAVHLARWPAPG